LLSGDLTRADYSNAFSSFRDTLNYTITSLEMSNVITDGEANQMLTITNTSFDCLENPISYEDLITFINEQIELWENYEYPANNNDGLLTASVLSIAKSSAEWWHDNWDEVSSELSPEIIELGPEGVSQVVVMDVVGGCIGAGVNAINQYATSDQFNGWSFALDVAWGAIDMSFGWSGKAATSAWKWISALK